MRSDTVTNLVGQEKQLGSVPNMFRLIANSPPGLAGYLGLNSALARGTFDAALREKIAIAVAETNGCTYCLSAHTYLGRNLAKTLFALISAFFMYRNGEQFAKQVREVMHRLLGERVDDYIIAIGDTTRAVVYGLVLAALAQGLLVGAGY